ncbi:unnamed protein product [Strongylus vulgaris]|uniref:Uncharacterized protein n=1 Tax=Strongylus vulgaris TaxID=40348 RepID=A0A3P7I5C1_STRVU|nr:unnamed protein product [Strongylus vulgaris]
MADGEGRGTGEEEEWSRSGASPHSNRFLLQE